MHSLRKMAAVNYFPSIHDNTSENKNIWTLIQHNPRQPHHLIITADSSKNFSNGAHRNRSLTQQVEAPAVWTTLGCLAVPDYQPLDTFSVTAEDPGSASWSEAEDICELSIKLKEIELRNMIGETFGIPQCKQTMIIMT